MTSLNDIKDRAILQDIARRTMLQRGLLPYFSHEALAELDKIQLPSTIEDVKAWDLRELLWSSIDNDDSLDLDQVTVAEAMPGDRIKIRVAIADVDSLVKKGSAIDRQARHNTTSIYTPGQIFPMLPERLSTNLTSLNLNEDRLAIAIDMVIDPDGSVQDSDIYRAIVRNHAKLAYDRIAPWLEGSADMPLEIAAVNGLAENLRLQTMQHRS